MSAELHSRDASDDDDDDAAASFVPAVPGCMGLCLGVLLFFLELSLHMRWITHSVFFPHSRDLTATVREATLLNLTERDAHEVVLPACLDSVADLSPCWPALFPCTRGHTLEHPDKQ